jgi:hypothetical protein
MKRLTLVSAIAVLLAGWTVSQAAETTAATDAAAEAAKPKRGGDCIFSRTISGWRVLDDKTMIVYGPTHNRPYEVKLWRPSQGLKFENQLGFLDKNSDGQFCDYGGDAIITSDMVADRIPVSSVRRIDEAEAKQLIDASKDKVGKEHEVKMPEQSDMKSDKQPEKKE